MPVDSISVPEFIEGDYCVRYRGPDMPAQSIRSGDVLVVGARDVAVGDLVVVTDLEDVAHVVEFEVGMSPLGAVTGLMRRIDA